MSGRLSSVRSNCFFRRHFATFAWSPVSSTSGTARPSQTSGRVYCGYSKSPSQWLSPV